MVIHFQSLKIHLKTSLSNTIVLKCAVLQQYATMVKLWSFGY